MSLQDDLEQGRPAGEPLSRARAAIALLMLLATCAIGVRACYLVCYPVHPVAKFGSALH